MLKFNKTIDNNVMTVTLEGRIDTTTAPGLEDDIASYFETIDGIILDLKDIEYISSAGLRVFLTIHKKIKNMTLKNVNPVVYEILEVTGFTDIFNIE